MTTTAEHLNYTPGLADGICPENCTHLVRLWGVASCTTFVVGLTQNRAGHAQRCKACLNHGVNDHNHHED